jgi:hypothetical protein
MRALLLALMIALLPVRGWVGDVMATQINPGRCPAMQNMAGSGHSHGADGHFDEPAGVAGANCLDSAGAPAHAGGDTDGQQRSPDHGRCGTPGVCQIYHTLALTSAAPFNGGASQPPLPWPARAMQFASAVPAVGLKPPIS